MSEALGYLEKLPSDELDRALGERGGVQSETRAAGRILRARFAALNDEIWDLRVAVLGEERAKERSPEDGKRSPVETTEAMLRIPVWREAPVASEALIRAIPG